MTYKKDLDEVVNKFIEAYAKQRKLSYIDAVSELQKTDPGFLDHYQKIVRTLDRVDGVNQAEGKAIAQAKR